MSSQAYPAPQRIHINTSGGTRTPPACRKIPHPRRGCPVHPRVRAGSVALLAPHPLPYTSRRVWETDSGVGPKLWKGDWWSAEEVGTRLSPGFFEAAKRGSTTAEVWVNKWIREPNIDGRCVRLTLDWLQTLVKDEFDWDEFGMVNTR
ncbi:hypothetical protein B0H13DRAFT_1911613 [Mycena leptocephala]|nr:hypothetical protein B0H13DRAFT_1911613 [Mycena leptocephala]